MVIQESPPVASASGQRPAPDLVIGPSHAARWSALVRDGVVDCHVTWDRISGRGGVPIWSSWMLNRAKDLANESLAVMIPDFRLGNSILLAESQPRDLILDGYANIDKRAMSTAQDRAILERCIASLQIWDGHFGPQARYLLWSLFGRTVQDTVAGRHFSEGSYRHPVFNYADIVSALPELNFIDLAPLLSLPADEVSRLLVDPSSHPSQIGYILLNGLIFEELDALTAYERAVDAIEAELHELAQRIAEAAGRKVLLTGRSVWLNTLSRYMGAEGTKRLADAGLVLAPLDRMPGRPALPGIVAETNVCDHAAVVISAGGKDLSGTLSRAFRTDETFWEGVPVIDWEEAAGEHITNRGETPHFSRLDETLSRLPGAVYPNLASSMLDYGALGVPSWSGVTAILRQVAEVA